MPPKNGQTQKYVFFENVVPILKIQLMYEERHAWKRLHHLLNFSFFRLSDKNMYIECYQQHTEKVCTFLYKNLVELVS